MNEIQVQGELRGAAGRRTYFARFVRAGRIRAAGGEAGALTLDPLGLQAAAAGGLFDGRAVFVDHSAGPRRPSVTRLVGVTAEARWNPADAAVEGCIRLYETPFARAVGALLDEILADGEAAPDVGLSMVFWPAELPAEGVISGIKHVESVDLVFEPAADGRILEKLQALEPRIARITRIENNPQMTQMTQMKPLTPYLLTPYPLIDPTFNHKGDANMETERNELLDVSRTLNASGLPQAARERLALGTYAGADELQAAIEGERQYLAQVTEGQVVQIGGTPPRASQISVGRSGLERLSLAVEALIAGVRPPGGVAPLTGIRELYHLLSGDYEMSGVYHAERVTLAAVDSATMAGMVANALNKRLAAEFQQYPRWWEPFVTIEDFASLQQVKWITLGGVGELPTVAEGAAYTELTWDDQTETAAFVKKGGYLGLTLEAIDKDETGRLRAAPRALAQSAWLTLAKAISAIFTASSGVGPALSDGKALFHEDHGNLGTAALSAASYAAARTAMRKQTELNSAERLGALTAPKFLLAPPDLEMTALQVLASPQDYTYTLGDGQAAPVNPLAEGNTFDARLASARGRVIVVDLWTDTNNWAAVADPHLYPSIGLGFRYGRTPEIFSVASPTAGLMFTNDTMPVKARFFFACGPVDYRGLYKANVS